MRRWHSRRLVTLATVSLAALSAQCGSSSDPATETLGRVRQGLSCSSDADCSSLNGPCSSGMCVLQVGQTTGACWKLSSNEGQTCDDGNACSTASICQSGTCVGTDFEPPQAPCWDKAIDRGIPTSLYDATTFLWNGVGRIQQGLGSNTIDPKRVAVVRGKVTDQNGAGLAGVSITISGHTEFGTTQTLGTDGWFDMVVNGGGELVMPCG